MPMNYELISVRWAKCVCQMFLHAVVAVVVDVPKIYQYHIRFAIAYVTQNSMCRNTPKYGQRKNLNENVVCRFECACVVWSCVSGVHFRAVYVVVIVNLCVLGACILRA